MNWRKIDKNNPRRLAMLIEQAFLIEGARKQLEKEAALLDAEVKEIKEIIIMNFDKSDLTEIKTKLGTARLVPKTVYQPDVPNDGWNKIWAYIVKTKSYDLLEKRLHQGACKARYEDKQKIPGVKLFDTAYIKLGDAE